MSIRIEHELRDMERLVDLLFSNTDEPLVKFTPTALEARNMSPDQKTAYELKAPLGWFMGYDVEREVYAYLTERKRAKETLRALKAAKAARAVITRRDDDVLLDKTVIGRVDETVEKFEAPEFKIELPNRVFLGDGRAFKRWLSHTRRAGADAIGVACTEPEALPPVKALPTLALKSFNEEVQFDFSPTAVELGAPKFGSAYKLELVEQFLPPSVYLWKPFIAYLDLLATEGYRMPMALNLEYGVLRFRAYVAPHLVLSDRFLRGLGLLKPLSKEDILRFVREWWSEKELACEAWDLERELRKEGFEWEYGAVEKLLTQLVKEERLIMRKQGYRRFYSPTEAPPPKVKPLTRSVVLKSIREMCEAMDTDAVGYLELEGFLAREYEVKRLHDILHGLREEGLVESKPWPVRRPGGYAVDMRGYWALKPTEPEEAVKQAEEKPLKPLTKDAVLSTIEKLHEEVGVNVFYNDILDRLAEEGYDTTALSDLVDELWKVDKKIKIWLDGKIWTKAFIERIEKKPPPVPPGYVRVRFLRDMVRFIGKDRKYYGPYKADEEAVIEKDFADAFERATYVEVLTRVEGGRSSSGFEPASPKTIPSPPPGEMASPQEVEGYIKLLNVNVKGKIERKKLPGYVDMAYVIPVVDEGTGEVVPIVYPFPTYRTEEYEMTVITNKLRKNINVLMLREEKAKIEVPMAKPEEVEEAVEAVEKEVPERVVTAPIDWTWMRGITTRMETWLRSMEHQAEVRNALALYTYLKSINEWMGEARERLLAGSEFLRMHEARKEEPVYRILTDEEYSDLWKLFSEKLREAKKDPAKYRKRFDDLIAWSMPYSDNEAVLLDEVRVIILENKLKKYIKKLPVKPIPFNWKHVQWGLGSLRIDVGVFKDAVREGNALQAYTTASKIWDTAERMKKLLENTPEVRAFRHETL